MSKDSETKIRKGSENVFADLGCSDSGTHLLKGQFRDVSVDRIMRMLIRLGCKVDIVIKLPGRRLSGSVIHFETSPA